MIKDIIDSMIFPSLYVGFVFTFLGAIMYSAQPTEINGFIGYRTSSSMKSQERWDFAQKYSSKVMMICGSVMIVLSMLGYFVPNDYEDKQLIGIWLLLISAITIIAVTEIAIKRRFKNK
jgi:uncharacterized membrane protein